MTDTLDIILPRRIDLAAANDIAARVRSGLRNELTRIVLRFAPDSSLCSSEFLGWLIAVGKHVSASGGHLVLTGLSSDNQRIFTAAGMGNVITIVDDQAESRPSQEE